jgi:hypothetical protein
MQVKIEYLWEMGPTWRLKLESEFSAGTHGKGEGAWALPGVARGHNSSLDRVCRTILFIWRWAYSLAEFLSKILVGSPQVEQLISHKQAFSFNWSPWGWGIPRNDEINQHCLAN